MHRFGAKCANVARFDFLCMRRTQHTECTPDAYGTPIGPSDDVLGRMRLGTISVIWTTIAGRSQMFGRGQGLIVVQDNCSSLVILVTYNKVTSPLTTTSESISGSTCISMTSESKTSITAYVHTTRENFLDWSRTLDAELAKRDLITITDEPSKLAKKEELKLRMQYKSLELTWDDAERDDYIKEYNTNIYHIVVASVKDKTTLQTIERSYADDGKGARAYIHSLWAVTRESNAAQEARQLDKDRARTAHIFDGAKSGSLTHMTEFVETLLEYNLELAHTDYKMSDKVVTNHVLDALAKHNDAFVQGYRGRYVGTTDWNADFGKIWTELKSALESNDGTKAAKAARETYDVLRTGAPAAPATSLADQVAALVLQTLQQPSVLQSLQDRSSSQRQPPPICDACGHPHRPDREHGCIGQAVSTGKISAAAAASKFTNIKNPTKFIKTAVDRYKAHQAAKMQPAEPAIVPRKTNPGVLMTRVDDTTRLTPGNLAPVGNPEGIGPMNYLACPTPGTLSVNVTVKGTL